MGGRRTDVIALQIADSLGAQQSRICGVFDALGNRAQPETLGQPEQVTQKDPIFGAVREVSDKGAVDLHRVHSQTLQVSQRSMPGPKIVERDAAARITQRIDKTRGLLDIIERRGLG